MEHRTSPTTRRRFLAAVATFTKALLEVTTARLIDEPVGGPAAVAMGDSSSISVYGQPSLFCRDDVRVRQQLLLTVVIYLVPADDDATCSGLSIPVKARRRWQ